MGDPKAKTQSADPGIGLLQPGSGNHRSPKAYQHIHRTAKHLPLVSNGLPGDGYAGPFSEGKKLALWYQRKKNKMSENEGWYFLDSKWMLVMLTSLDKAIYYGHSGIWFSENSYIWQERNPQQNTVYIPFPLLGDKNLICDFPAFQNNNFSDAKVRHHRNAQFARSVLLTSSMITHIVTKLFVGRFTCIKHCVCGKTMLHLQCTPSQTNLGMTSGV